MYSKNSNIADSTILSLLKEDSPEAWEHLYDKYAYMMYVTVYDLTGDEKIAKEIFVEAILLLKRQELLSQVSGSIGLYLFRHTYNFSIHQLKLQGRTPLLKDNNLYDNCALLKLLWTQAISIKEAGSTLHLTEKEAKKELQDELNYIHHHHEMEHGRHSPLQAAYNKSFSGKDMQHQEGVQFSKINLKK